MRLWSLHPRYLDPQGLVALWRESLLANAVLKGVTKGYRHHPQLLRFREQPDPLAAINGYLRGIFVEAVERGYRFDEAKLCPVADVVPIQVTEGQLAFEREHLLRKLAQRSPERATALMAVENPSPHPSFAVVPGPVERWER